jgi:predicted NUDIX family NTP pyrophosphohydrolase
VVAQLGDGHGRFSPAPGSPFPVGRGAWSLALGDYDGDGKGDVATADLEAGTVTVLLRR